MNKPKKIFDIDHYGYVIEDEMDSVLKNQIDINSMDELEKEYRDSKITEEDYLYWTELIDEAQLSYMKEEYDEIFYHAIEIKEGYYIFDPLNNGYKKINLIEVEKENLKLVHQMEYFNSLDYVNRLIEMGKFIKNDYKNFTIHKYNEFVIFEFEYYFKNRKNKFTKKRIFIKGEIPKNVRTIEGAVYFFNFFCEKKIKEIDFNIPPCYEMEHFFENKTFDIYSDEPSFELKNPIVELFYNWCVLGNKKKTFFLFAESFNHFKFDFEMKNVINRQEEIEDVNQFVDKWISSEEKINFVEYYKKNRLIYLMKK